MPCGRGSDGETSDRMNVTTLEWDSQFFGRRIGRVEASRLREGDVTALQRNATERGLECLYLLADPNCDETARVASRAGFRMVDIRITLERRASSRAEERSMPVRQATTADLVDLEPIAARGHVDTRFYHDGRFPSDRCDELYRTWIRVSVEGRLADAVLCVDDAGGKAAAYVTCRVTNGEGQIGLVGVSDRVQGRGIGGALIQASLDWFADHGATRISVVTQGRNVRAQRLYQRAGFLTSDVGVWFHWWRDEDQKVSSASMT